MRRATAPRAQGARLVREERSALGGATRRPATIEVLDAAPGGAPLRSLSRAERDRVPPRSAPPRHRLEAPLERRVRSRVLGGTRRAWWLRPRSAHRAPASASEIGARPRPGGAAPDDVCISARNRDICPLHRETPLARPSPALELARGTWPCDQCADVARESRACPASDRPCVSRFAGPGLRSAVCPRRVSPISTGLVLVRAKHLPSPAISSSAPMTGELASSAASVRSRP